MGWWWVGDGYLMLSRAAFASGSIVLSGKFLMT
jgi:hypothetical protein